MYSFYSLSPSCSDLGTKDRKYGHAMIVGIDRAPKRVTRSMSKKRIAKRSQITPFIKVVNFSHLMVTRYAADKIDLKGALPANDADLKDATKKKAIKKEIRRVLEEKYVAGENKWFFQKLRF